MAQSRFLRTVRWMLDGLSHAARVRESGLTIYDDCPSLLRWPTETMEQHLQALLRGLDLALPIRSRALRAKQAVAVALGYPVPATFARVTPRFPAQDLEVIVQKAHNVQLWNAELVAHRRFALIQVDDNDCAVAVKVADGAVLGHLAGSGVTTKRQAFRPTASRTHSLCIGTDTERFKARFRPIPALCVSSGATPPLPGVMADLGSIYNAVRTLVGQHVDVEGFDQERRRGDRAGALVADALSICGRSETGQFPDLPSQAVEVKLSSSSMIDLGTWSPDDRGPLRHTTLAPADVRYVVLSAQRRRTQRLTIDAVVVVSGERFFDHFTAGQTIDRKIQISLPRNFFGPEGLPVVPGRDRRIAARSAARPNR